MALKFSEKSLHVFVARQILQKLLIMIRVVRRVVARHVILTELVPAAIAIRMIVALVTAWTWVADVWITVVELVWLIDAIWLVRRGWFIRGLVILAEWLGLRNWWMICVFYWIVHRTEVINFGIFNIHLSRLEFFLMKFLLLKHLGNFISIVFLSP